MSKFIFVFVLFCLSEIKNVYFSPISLLPFLSFSPFHLHILTFSRAVQHCHLLNHLCLWQETYVLFNIVEAKRFKICVQFALHFVTLQLNRIKYIMCSAAMHIKCMAVCCISFDISKCWRQTWLNEVGPCYRKKAASA